MSDGIQHKPMSQTPTLSAGASSVANTHNVTSGPVTPTRNVQFSPPGAKGRKGKRGKS